MRATINTVNAFPSIKLINVLIAFQVPNLQGNPEEDSIWLNAQNPTDYVQNLLQDTLNHPNSQPALHGLRIAFWHMADTLDWYPFVRSKYFSFLVILFFLSVDILHSQNIKIIAFSDRYRLSKRLTEVHNNHPTAPSVHHYKQFSNHPLVTSTAAQVGLKATELNTHDRRQQIVHQMDSFCLPPHYKSRRPIWHINRTS
jgi:hypothetical protein